MANAIDRWNSEVTAQGQVIKGIFIFCGLITALDLL